MVLFGVILNSSCIFCCHALNRYYLPSDLGLQGCIEHVWRDTVVYLDDKDPIFIGRAYGRVSRHLLHEELLRRCSLTFLACLYFVLGYILRVKTIFLPLGVRILALDILILRWKRLLKFLMATVLLLVKEALGFLAGINRKSSISSTYM